MKYIDLKRKAVIDAKFYSYEILNTVSTLDDLLDDIMGKADVSVDYDSVRYKLANIMISTAVDYRNEVKA